MYKIAFKNPIIPLCLLILSVAASVSSEYFQLVKTDLPVWVLVGLIALYLFVSVAFYAKASIKQYFAITGYISIFAFISLGISLATSFFLGYIKLEGISLNLSIITLVVNALIPVLAIKLFVTLQNEASLVKEVKVQVQPEISDAPVQEQKEELTKEQEGVSSETKLVEAEEVEEDIYLEDIAQEVPSVPVVEPVSNVVSESDVEEEIYMEDMLGMDLTSSSAKTQAQQMMDQQKQELEKQKLEEALAMPPEPVMELEELQVEPQTALQPVVDDVQSQPKEQSIVEEKPVKEMVIFEELGELPSFSEIELEPLKEETLIAQEEPPVVSIPPIQEKSQVVSQSQAMVELQQPAKTEILYEDEIEEEKPQSYSVRDIEESVDHLQSQEKRSTFIPKLSQVPTNKESESGARITAIGKLLVDKRDIENIIETNALMQHVGAEATTTKIISPHEGAKISEKINSIKTLGAHDVVVVNEAGFIQSSTIQDFTKEQVIGAVVSGTFGVVSSALKQFGFPGAKDVTFESSSGSLILSRLGSDITAIFIEQGASLYKCNHINEILVVSAEMSPDELIDSFSSVDGILGVVIASREGLNMADKIIDSGKNASEIAQMMPAFYNNMGVFLRNVNYGDLRRAIINTGNEMLFFTDLGSNLIFLYTTLNSSIESDDNKVQYDALIG